MIVTDLDGTLLKDDKSVTEFTRNVLKQCRAKGIKTALATARGHPEKLVPVELFDGRITNNGAVIIADNVVYRRNMSYQEARPLLMACDKRGLKMTSQDIDMHYTNFDISAIWPHIKGFEIVDFSKHEIDSDKICMENGSPDDIEFMRQNLSDNMYLTVTRDNLAMVMHRDATKSKAVATLAKHWGIEQEEIAVFGDDMNDIDMLEYAGAGVAMGNALDEVKTAAGYICDTNENDGLAKWLEENAL
ncbi:MAG: HAD family hydrolase [Oscillospiraceae bacterium]|nr:HAD family hydrolase [Oscillospiraceae bacterium]